MAARIQSPGTPGFGLLVLVIAATMGGLVIVPLARLLYEVFFSAGTFSTAQLTETLADPELKPALVNTAVVIAASGGAALLVGSVLAWLNERTDARVGWAADVLPILPILVPTVAVAVGWVFLLAPTAGFLNALLRYLLATAHLGVPDSGPLNIYGMAGIIFVTAILAVPYVYLVISAALQNVDPALEEASLMSGVGPIRTFFRITMPALWNAVATAVVLLVIVIIALFSVPVVIGIGARIDVLSVLIFRVIYSVTPARLDEGVVLSFFMLAAVQLVVLFELAVARTRRHATVGGRGHVRATATLGPLRWPARLAMLVYLGAATVLPLGGLVLVSVQRFWTSHVVWSRLSLFNYGHLFQAEDAFGQSLINSLGLAVVTATAIMLVAALISVYTETAPGAVARAINAVATLPSSLPHTVVAIGLLITLGVGRVSLEGTLLLLFLAYAVLFVPLATRTAGNAISQIGRDLWEASFVNGASRLRTFRRVLLPLMLPGLTAGWVMVFAQSLSEMSASVFLSGTTNPVVGPVILQYWQVGGTYPQLASLAVVITAVQTVAALVVLLGVRPRLARHRG